MNARNGNVDDTPEEAIPGDNVLFDRFATRYSRGSGSGLKSMGVQGLVDHYTSLLPPAEQFHMLLSRYYSYPYLAGIQKLIPRGGLQLAFDALFPGEEDPGEEAATARKQTLPPLAQANQLSFVAMVFASLAVGKHGLRFRQLLISRKLPGCSQLHLGAGYSADPEASDESRDLAIMRFEYSRQASLESETRERPTYCTIAALIINTCWVKMISSPSIGYSLVASAIRQAHALVS